MLRCPVCNSEYSEYQHQKCPECQWYLIPDLQVQHQYVNSIKVIRYQQQVTEWAKNTYEKTKISSQSSLLNNQLAIILKKIELLIYKQDRQQEQISNIQQQLQVINNSQEQKIEISDVENDDFNSNFLESIVEETNSDLLFSDSDLEREINNQQASLYQKKRTLNTPEEVIKNYQQSNELEEAIKEPSDNDLLPFPNNQQNIEQSNKSDLISSLPSNPRNNQEEEQQQLINAYNNKQDLSQWSIKVSEIETSIEARRAGDNNNKVTFKKDRRQGDYWIIDLEYGKYLVPNFDIKLNQPNIKALKFLFRCESQDSIDSLQLIKPGKVLTKGEYWELEESGIIEFISNQQGGSDEEE